MRRGASVLGIVLIVAALAAAVARADGGAGTTTTATTTTSTTTTEATTTTTTTTTPTTTTTAPTYVPLVRSRLARGCVGAGVAAIQTTGGATVALGLPPTGLGSAYPTSHDPFLTFDSATGTGSRCGGSVTLTNVSLFGGAVMAKTVRATNGKGNVSGLEINGLPVTAKRGESVAVGNWGLLELGANDGRLSAPLALRLVRSHGSLAARTTIYIGFGARPQSPSHVRPRPVVHHRHRPPHRQTSRAARPLSATPWLGYKTKHYVFPIDGGASYIDTYGAGRNDIYNGWHHGDDLFAPLGTPVVAVANGTLTLVGWNSLGGWRLWLTDNKGNSFYYAHLAGYARRILHHRRVEAGQVIGFLGRTGDAFTTPPHVHFEIHPHRFEELGYDGAVNPTPYLESWRIAKVPADKIPAAARLRAPAGTPSQEAAVVWQELLKARHLMPDGMPAVALTPSLHRPFPAAQKPEAVVETRRLASPRRRGDAPSPPPSPWPSVTLGLSLAGLASAGSLAFVRRRRSG